ncbi:unnamed protein product [Chrysoparadoxa australica]
MEELQDAIEDAQYLSAVMSKTRDGPRPCAKWDYPTAREVQDFQAKQIQKDSSYCSMEKLCSEILGIYLLREHCASMGESVKLEFMLDVVRYKRLQGRNQRRLFALGMIQNYLTVGAQGTAIKPLRDLDLVRVPEQPKHSWEALGEMFSVPADYAPDVPPPAATEGPEAGGKDAAAAANTPVASMTEDEPPKAFTYCLLGVEGSGVEDLQSLLEVEANLQAARASHPNQAAADSKVRQSQIVNMEVVRQAASVMGTGCVLNSNGELTAASHDGFANTMHSHLKMFDVTLFDDLESWVFMYLAKNVYEQFMESQHALTFAKFDLLSHRDVEEDDFILFRMLGRGGFGAVNGCKRATTGKLYAMKVMNKRRIKAKKSEDLCWNERNILCDIDTPLMVSLKYAFQSTADLFLILDLMTGGDLSFHLRSLGTFSPEMCKYYTARCVLALGHLHGKGYVYRDLKPENILLDEDGRSKISDMGLACKVTSDLVGACGTRGYWAPEMRARDENGKRIPYNECTDWFTVGCVLYEFICGVCPFRTERAKTWCIDTIKEKDKRIDQAVMEMEPEYPPGYFDSVNQDLCQKLLQKDPKQRLGADGYREVLEHAYFDGIDFGALLSLTAPGPFIPEQDINAAPQRAIGSFAQDRNTQLHTSDQNAWTDWQFSSRVAFQQEVVGFLEFEKDEALRRLNEKSSMGCCAVS